MTEPIILADAEARARAEGDLDRSFIVEAAAGGGKTTLLVRRLLGLVVDRGVPLRRIIATTFTDRAASEITLRLREALEERRHTGTPAQERAAEAALLQMEDARVGTLHAIAGELLRQVPLACGVDPEFVVLGADEARALRDRAVREHLGVLLAAPPEGLRRWLRRPRDRGDDDVLTRLSGALEMLAEQRDLATPWTSPAGFDRDAELEALLSSLGPIAERVRGTTLPSSDRLGTSVVALSDLHAAWQEERSRGGDDRDGWEVALATLAVRNISHAGHHRAWKSKAIYEELKTRRDAWLERRARFVSRAEADLAARLRAELWPALARYEVLKRDLGALDFHDLTAELRRVLVTEVEVRRFFAKHIDHIVVDEVQDSDPAQLELLALLAADDPEIADPTRAVPRPGKLFMVGDPKQSIYGFRRSSVDGYLRFRDRMVECGVELLQLTSTFRCLPSIARVVDLAMQTAFEPGPFQPSYTHLSPTRQERAQPSVVALPVPDPLGHRGDVYQDKVTNAMPEIVASFVSFLVHESGWTVEEGGQPVPMRPRHIALLGRNFKRWGHDLVGPIARALEERGIPHAHIGGRSFHHQEEIAHLRAVLTAIEWPDDELAIYAALRGPFLAHADADLFTYRGLYGSLSPHGVPQAATFSRAHQAIADSLGLLRELHRFRTRRPIPDTISRFLAASGALLSMAAADRGDLLLLRTERFVELALQREALGALSFRRFVEELDDASERDDDVAVVAPADADAVRFSTVHGAKGLEYPVVILFDPTTAKERGARVMDIQKRLFVDRFLGLSPAEHATYEAEAAARASAEGARLLYVAATRARDLLVVPTTGDGPIGGWMQPLERAIRPTSVRDARPAPGCPPFGDKTLLVRSDQPSFEAQPGEIAPGLHLVGDREAPARVVFWDPERLSRGRGARAGLRRRDVFEEVQGAGASGSERAHHAFEAQLAERAARIDPGVEVVRLRDLGMDAGVVAATNVDVEPLGLGLAPPAAFAGAWGDRLLRAALLGFTREGHNGAHRAAEAEAVRSGAEREAVEATMQIVDALVVHPDLAPVMRGLRHAPFAFLLSPRLLIEGEVFVSPFVEALEALVALHVHAGSEPPEVARLRIAVAASGVARASGRATRAVLVLPFE